MAEAARGIALGGLGVRYFEDFRAGDIIELGATTVSAEEIVAFARRYDPQPFHMDQGQAKQSIYGGLIASGWHTAALFMRLMVDGLLNRSASMGSPGVDQLRWLKPVRPDDRLRAQLTVLETIPSRSKPDRGIVRARGDLFNRDDALVMSFEAAMLFGRRPERADDE